MFVLYTIPEPGMKLYFVDMDDKKAKFTENKKDAPAFKRNIAIGMQKDLKDKYDLDLQMESK